MVLGCVRTEVHVCKVNKSLCSFQPVLLLLPEQSDFLGELGLKVAASCSAFGSAPVQVRETRG